MASHDVGRSLRNAFRINEYARWKAEAAKQVHGSKWNQQFRRVVDIRPVKNDSSAVYEVIKYISKTNRFLDNPDAVELLSYGSAWCSGQAAVRHLLQLQKENYKPEEALG